MLSWLQVGHRPWRALGRVWMWLQEGYGVVAAGSDCGRAPPCGAEPERGEGGGACEDVAGEWG